MLLAEGFITLKSFNSDQPTTTSIIIGDRRAHRANAIDSETEAIGKQK